MGDKKQTSFTKTPAQQKASDEYNRKQARDKADQQKTKEYTAQNEAAIQAGKKQAQAVHPEVRGGKEQADAVDKSTRQLHALDTMNPALLDRAIDEATGGGKKQKAYAEND